MHYLCDSAMIVCAGMWHMSELKCYCKRERKKGRWWNCKPRLRTRWLHRQTPPTATCSWRWEEGQECVCVCVCVCHVGEEAGDGGGAELEQLIKALNLFLICWRESGWFLLGTERTPARHPHILTLPRKQGWQTRTCKHTHTHTQSFHWKVKWN